MEQELKLFKTYDEQIEKLRSKKLIINDEKNAVFLLKKLSYFGLVSGYKKPFKDKEGNYKLRTKFEDIYYLYQFDDELRHILIRYLLIVELHIKSLISYNFCSVFGEQQASFIDKDNYNYNNSSDTDKIIDELVELLQNKLEEETKVSYVKHQEDNHGNIPLWVIVKLLTFGNISKMYSCQKPEIQSAISHEFTEVNENELGTALDILTRYRNVCAHNERLYDYTYKKKRIKTNKIHEHYSLDEKRKPFTTLFDIIIILKYLLDVNEFSSLVDDISSAFVRLAKKTNQIQRKQLLALMGFPNDWETIKNLEI